MNKSIYKKQLAFKNSLPQYKDGGNIFQKAGAGALGVLSKVPIIQSFAPMMENAKIVENNQASFNTGQGIGAVGMAVGKGLTGDIGGAVSSGLDAGKEFMEVGSTVAKQKGNTERADRLDKAAMGFQAGSQAAGMASMMGGNFKSGEGISKMLGFGTMFGNTGGNIPIEMKNGGSITNLPNNMASFRYKDGAIHKGNPTAELELKENGLDGDGEPFQVNAPSHEEGGVEVKLKEGAKILSDNKDLFGKKTPAKEAASLIKGLKQLQNREDSISENTKKRYEEKINEIFQAQEQFKKMKQAKSNPLMMKNGGKLPKYNDGAYFNPYSLGSGTVDTFANSIIPTNVMGINSISNNNLQMTPQFRPTTSPTIGSNYKITNEDTSSLFPTKNRFAPATMNNPTLAGNKTNPNLLPINNPIIPSQSGMSQRRAVDFGADFDRNSPFKADKADTGSIFSQPGVAGGALKNVPSTLYNLGVGLFGKVQKTPPILADKTKKQGPVIFNPDDILRNRNAALAQIGQTAGSINVANAMKQSLYRGTNTQLAKLAQEEALANVGIEQQNEARALQENLTDQKARQLAQQLDISAENAKKLALQEGIAGIGEIMDDTSKQKIAYGENQLGFGALQTMFSNWKLKNPGGTYSSFLKSIGKGGGAIEFVS